MYLGREEVLMVAKKGSDVQITFKGENKQSIKLNKDLFDLAKRDKPTSQEPMDAVFNRLVKKIFIELADYGLTCLEVTTFVSHLGNLIHNRREEVIGKKFDVTGSQFIKLKDLL